MIDTVEKTRPAEPQDAPAGTSRWRRAAWWIDDRLNPLLVRDLRQWMRSRSLVVLFILVLLGMTVLMGLNLGAVKRHQDDDALAFGGGGAGLRLVEARRFGHWSNWSEMKMVTMNFAIVMLSAFLATLVRQFALQRRRLAQWTWAAMLLGQVGLFVVLAGVDVMLSHRRPRPEVDVEAILFWCTGALAVCNLPALIGLVAFWVRTPVGRPETGARAETPPMAAEVAEGESL